MGNQIVRLILAVAVAAAVVYALAAAMQWANVGIGP